MEIEKVKVSIIIPIFNNEDFIAKTLESAINQTLKEIEIIFVNDGSTDKSLEIINKYKTFDSRIKIINQKNQGALFSRFEGIKIATGEYIQMVDGDDFLKIDCCEKLYKFAKKNSLDIVISDYQQNNIRKNGLEEKATLNNIQYLNLFFKNKSKNAIWIKFFRRELLKYSYKPKQNFHLGDDIFLTTVISANAQQIKKIDEVCIFYNTNPNSIMNKSRLNKTFELFIAYDEIENFLKENNYKLFLKYKNILELKRFETIIHFISNRPNYHSKEYNLTVEYILNYMKTRKTIPKQISFFKHHLLNFLKITKQFKLTLFLANLILKFRIVFSNPQTLKQIFSDFKSFNF